MKRNEPLFITLCAVSCAIIGISFICLMGCAVLFGSSIGSGDYFADQSNYKQFDCKIEHVDSKNLDDGDVFLRLEPDIDGFREKDFGFENKDNCRIAAENGVADILEKGAVIRIWATPAIAGNAWTYSIAGISYNGKEYLPFEVGYKNIAERQYEASHSGVVGLSVSGAVLVFGILMLVVNILIYLKSKKPTAPPQGDEKNKAE